MVHSERRFPRLPLALTRRRVVLCALLIAAGGFVVAERALAGIGAGALLHPHRRALSLPTPSGCSDVEFDGDEVKLAGWWLVGASLGAAVALQTAADDPRISAIARRKRLPICERWPRNARRFSSA
jgi:hypothetical protein